MRKKTIQKKDIGIDGINFSLQIATSIIKFREVDLINSFGTKYGKIESTKNGFDVYVCLPKFNYEDNRTPFKIADCINLDLIREDVEHQLKIIFGFIPESYLKSIEINITHDIGDNVKTTDVMELVGNALTTVKKAGVFYRSREVDEYGRILCTNKIESFSINNEHRYLFKIYDKSLQLKNVNARNVPDNLLRIELRFYGRTLKKLFDRRLSINDILTKKSLAKCINEYIRIMDKEIITGAIIPYMNQCVLEIVEQLGESDKVATGILNSRKLLYDKEILRKALKKYYALNATTKDATAKNLISYYCNNSKVKIPQNVIATIKMFHLVAYDTY